MNYTSDKKRKKLPEPTRKRINLGIPINIPASSLGSRAGLDTDPQGNQDRFRCGAELHIDLIRLAIDDGNPGPPQTVFYEEKSKGRGHSAPEMSTRGMVAGGTGHGGNCTGGCF